MEEHSSNRIDRRRFLKLAGMAGLTMAGLEMAACGPSAAPPLPTATTKAAAPAASPKAESAEEQLAKMIEAAKKEGKVTIYSVGSIEESEKMVRVFNKKYPFIQVEPYTGTSEDLAEKILTESKAGKNIADVIRADTAISPVLDAGLAMKYLSPESANFPKGSYDPEGTWRFLQYTVHSIAWNTKAIAAADAPRSYDDLLNPKYKGKLAIEAECLEWFTQQLAIRGRDKGLEYMKRLADQKPRLVKGHTTLSRLVVAGEVPMAVMVYAYRSQLDKESKAPVEWVADKPATANQTMLVIHKDAPHPNAAKLMLDWWLSKQGQEDEVIGVSARFPVRPGVTIPDFYKGVDVYTASLETLKQTRQNSAQFREIFGIV